MFLSIKARPFLIFILIIVSSFVISYSIVNIKDISTIEYKYKIVLDAGHGGIDGGCVGVNTGVKESDLNLSIVKKLKPYFEAMGFEVIMTRNSVDGLYGSDMDNYKQSDMEARRKIIQNASANLVISIHMNSWPRSDCYGAQVYYQQGNESSKVLADTMQTELINHIERSRNFANEGDYYILKCSNTPTVLVECGYLSNPIDEQNLIDNEYQEKLSYHMFCGVVRYMKIIKG